MIPAPFRLTRRGALAGLAMLAAVQPFRRTLAGNDAATVAIRPGAGGAVFDPTFPANLRRGDRLRVNVTNSLAVPISLGVLGLDGVPALQPLLNAALEPGKMQLIEQPLGQAGTFLLEARSLEDGAGAARAIAAFSVDDASSPRVDRDETLLIEDVRLRADGSSVAPGLDSGDTRTVYSVNGQTNFDLRVRTNQRLRLRLINGCQRNAIALQFDDHDLRVIAIDSRPAEPFLARDRRLILAPGTRMDVLIDATQPAGATSAVQLFDGGGPKRIGQLSYGDGAPARAQLLPPAQPLDDGPIKLALASAHRAQLDLGSSSWLSAEELATKRPPPLFRVKQANTVLLTLTNRTTGPITFRLYGHHFRWLDRLDDGWKPFLPDTMLVDVGRTERIAFRTDVAGDWLIESTAMSWSAPRKFHWFAVS